MQMYQIRVGDTMYPGVHDEQQAEKIICHIKHCVKDKIELIPVKQGATV